MEQDCFVKRSEEEVRPGADFQAGFLFFITIEFSQSVHFIVHDNRMFAERAFYCCSCRIEVFSYSPPFSNHFEVVLSMNYASDFQ